MLRIRLMGNVQLPAWSQIGGWLLVDAKAVAVPGATLVERLNEASAGLASPAPVSQATHGTVTSLPYQAVPTMPQANEGGVWSPTFSNIFTKASAELNSGPRSVCESPSISRSRMKSG